MGANLEKVGIDNKGSLNNSIIMNELFKSAKGVTAENPASSIVLKGTNGSVRIDAKWKVQPDGIKRLTTVITGTF